MGVVMGHKGIMSVALDCDRSAVSLSQTTLSVLLKKDILQGGKRQYLNTLGKRMRMRITGEHRGRTLDYKI
jgi:hypothetical protein